MSRALLALAQPSTLQRDSSEQPRRETGPEETASRVSSPRSPPSAMSWRKTRLAGHVPFAADEGRSRDPVCLGQSWTNQVAYGG